jgi:hypothetical protein
VSGREAFSRSVASLGSLKPKEANILPSPSRSSLSWVLSDVKRSKRRGGPSKSSVPVAGSSFRLTGSGVAVESESKI